MDCLVLAYQEAHHYSEYPNCPISVDSCKTLDPRYKAAPARAILCRDVHVPLSRSIQELTNMLTCFPYVLLDSQYDP